MHSSPENTLASCNHPIRAINGLDLLQTCTGLIYVSKNYCSTQIGKSWSNMKPKFWHMKVQILSEMTILPSYVASFSETISLRWPNQPQSFVKIPKSLPPSFSTFSSSLSYSPIDPSCSCWTSMAFPDLNPSPFPSDSPLYLLQFKLRSLSRD